MVLCILKLDRSITYDTPDCMHLSLLNAILDPAQSHAKQEQSCDHSRDGQWFLPLCREGIGVCDLGGDECQRPSGKYTETAPKSTSTLTYTICAWFSVHDALRRVTVCRPVVSRNVLCTEWVMLSTGNGVNTSTSLRHVYQSWHIHMLSYLTELLRGERFAALHHPPAYPSRQSKTALPAPFSQHRL